MPDTCAAPGGAHDPALIAMPPLEKDGPELLLWPVRKKEEDDVTAAARQFRRDLQAAEYRRLLYVAMTRARDRLYIAGYRGVNPPPEECWYELARKALLPDAKEVKTSDGRVVWRIEGEQRREVEAEEVSSDVAPPALPVWVSKDAPEEPALARPLAPSRLPPEDIAEPAVLSPLAEDGAHRFRRGSLIHRLLQTLPDLEESARHAAAARFLALPAHGLTGEEREEIENAVFRVLDDPRFASVFAKPSRAEVPVAGTIGFRGRTLLVGGQIDRLCISDDEVIIVDYKTNRPPPTALDQVSEAYLVQMAAYRAVLAQIYPNHVIRCGLLWTDGPSLMDLPAEMLEMALKQAKPAAIARP